MKIKAIVFGASGMIGSGVLIEALAHPSVEAVLSIGRSTTGVQHPKLTEIIHKDFTDFSAIEDQLAGYNACFFCLGISSFRMSEEAYRRITVDFTKKAGEVLSRLNPEMTFCFISGAGTDATSNTMWARVKGEAENILKTFPFKQVFLMRPGYIQPVKGVKSKTKLYSIIYFFIGSLYPLWKRLFPKIVSTSEEIGLAMIHAVLHGYEKETMESIDVVELAHRHNLS
ncbi:MAG: NAD-dependent epimerase/dehydratase family protein [Bacteroidota bacterium]